MIRNWWFRLFAALLIALLVMAFIIARTPRVASQPALISDDVLLTAEAEFTPEAIQRLLVARGSPLASYTETVAEQTLTAAQLFWVAAQHSDYGLSPKALIT